MNLTKYLIDQKFVSEMKEYAEIVNELLKYGKDEAAYSYKLCFYAQLIGFMNKNFSIFGANFKKVSNTLSIDKQILDDINLHLTSKEVLLKKIVIASIIVTKRAVNLNVIIPKKFLISYYNFI